jgi:hypothetical protein
VQYAKTRHGQRTGRMIQRKSVILRHKQSNRKKKENDVVEKKQRNRKKMCSASWKENE